MEVTAASLAVSAGAHAAMTMNVYADLFDKNIDEFGSAMDAAYGDVFQVPPVGLEPTLGRF